ncbi:hypothetical protein [Desulfitobacterium metallireducens]|uniref:Uncharacterized protein n=1 Tax=Desulfitobacterium metallireducens DSM 15288 TaxID=871968 RepID=W0E511_9FIRM|nr:hypothetical protein [Desulfitobacterium metallireducens]AHF05950.1 hypothetical protein DESME_01790 [Desulfitobacterium metallireducens DSM 15288]
MYGYCHYPHISPVGAPPHVGPVGCCYPPVGVGAGVGIIAIAILILLALGVIV